jgi:hypothetical protein
VKTYLSILSNLHKRVFGGKAMDLKDFTKSHEILEHLKDVPSNVRKTTLSALFILTQNPEYRKLMGEDIEKYNEMVNKRELSPQLKEEWISKEKMQDLYQHYKRNADLLYKKKDLTTNDLQQIQNYIMVCLYSGLFIPPRRALDMAEFKIKNINKTDDNFIEKDKLFFNKFKTAKFNKPEQKEVIIPKELKTILTKWIKVNPTDWLLFDVKGGKLTSVKINQRLQKLFGHGVAINSLRKIYLSNKYDNLNEIQRSLAKDMGEMGSSSQQQAHYVLS